MAFNPNVPGVKKDVKDSPFLTLSQRNKEGLSSENVHGAQKTQSTKSIEGKNIFGQDEAQGINQDVQMFTQEEKGAEEYLQEDEQGNVSFDEAGFYDDAWGINLSNSAGATDPIKASSSKSQGNISQLKDNLTNLIKRGKTNTEIESAKDELKTQGVSDVEIKTLEETAKKEASKTGSNKSATENKETKTSAGYYQALNDGTKVYTDDKSSPTPYTINDVGDAQYGPYNVNTGTNNPTLENSAFTSTLADTPQAWYQSTVSGMTNAEMMALASDPSLAGSSTSDSGSSSSTKTEKTPGFFSASNFMEMGKTVGTNVATQAGTNVTMAGLEKGWEWTKEKTGWGKDEDVKEAEKVLDTEKSKLEDMNEEKEKAMKDNSAAKEYEEAKSEYETAKTQNEEETQKEGEWNKAKEKATKDLTDATAEQGKAQQHYDKCVLDEQKAQSALDTYTPQKDDKGNETEASVKKRNELKAALETAKQNKKLAKEELTKKDKAKEAAQTEADKYKGDNPHTKPKEESAKKMTEAKTKMDTAKTEANKVKSGTTDTIDKLNANITKQQGVVKKAEADLAKAKKKAAEKEKEEKK